MAIDLIKLEKKFAKLFEETSQEDFERWLEEKHTPQSIPLSVVEALEKANPHQWRSYPTQHTTWKDCVSKLRELLAAQPKEKGNVEDVVKAMRKIGVKVTETNDDLVYINIDLFKQEYSKSLSQSSPSKGEEKEVMADQDSLFQQIKTKMFLTNLLNPEWTEEFKKEFIIIKK